MQPPQNAPAPDFITPEDIGKGLSHQEAQTPSIDVAQVNSDYLDKSSAKYIEGAQAGDLVIPLAPNPIHNGETGIPIIPVDTLDTWVEWMEGRQGFVARHPTKPADAIEQISQDSGKPKVALSRPSGTILVETKELYCLFEGMPFVMWCSSTRISALDAGSR
jgi:hypothetical protein